MIDNVANILTGFMIVILSLALLNLFGDWTADRVPAVMDTTGDVVHELGDATQKVIQPGYQR